MFVLLRYVAIHLKRVDRKTWFGFLLSAVAMASPALAQSSQPSNVINYTISPNLEQDKLVGLNVTMAFTGNSEGTTWLFLPDSRLAVTPLWKNVSQLEIVGASVSGTEGQRMLQHAPNSQIKISYTVSSPIPTSAIATDVIPRFFNPIIQPDWFSVPGATVFARIANRNLQYAQLQLIGFPTSWVGANSLETKREPNGLIADVDLWRSVVTVGAKFERWSSADGQTSLVVRPNFENFDVNSIGMTLERLLSQQRKFWGDDRTPFLMSIADFPSPDLAEMSIGVGLNGAFAGWLSQNVTVEDTQWLLAHEILHTWIAGELGESDPNRPWVASTWFSEGFTDYYADRMLLKAGLWTPEQWVKNWNERLRNFHESPVRLAPNRTITDSFLTDTAFRLLPYQRGALLAANIDYRIRKNTNGQKSLDDVILIMRTALRDRRQSPTKSLPEISAQFAQTNIKDLVEGVAEAGGDIVFPAEGWGNCLVVTPVTRPAFDVGFDRERSFFAGNVATSVKLGSNAYKAGLREGMKIMRRTAGELNNTDIPVTYEIEIEPGKTVALSWLPQGDDIATQILRLGSDFDGNASPVKRAACIDLIAGRY